MNTDTPQKTWTLRLTPQDAPDTTLEGIPQDQVASILWRAMHGYGPIDQVAADVVGQAEIAGSADRHEQRLAA